MEPQLTILGEFQRTTNQTQDDQLLRECISQDFTHLVPYERAKDFNPGRITDFYNRICVFKVKKELKKPSIKSDLPSLRRIVQDENNQNLSFTQNSSLTSDENGIFKRTLTVKGDDRYSLWEYVKASDNNTWTVLHNYGAKQIKSKETSASSTDPTGHETTDDVVMTDEALEKNEESCQMIPPDNNPVLQAGNNTNVIANDRDFHDWINTFSEVKEESPNANDGGVSNSNDDDLLPNIPAHMYYKLLSDSIAERKFFNNPITVHEDLFRFKTTIYVDHKDHETDEVTQKEQKIYLEFGDMTSNNFEYITESRFIHLVSPAGTGKTMTMLQLAKNIGLDREKLVTVVCKAEYFWREHGRSKTMVDILVNSSMATADIRTEADQQEWKECLSQVIQHGTGVVLLLDAADEMTSVERDDFLQHIKYMTQDIPGQVDDVNIVALVLSSRPGVTLPTTDDVQWTTLKMAKVKNSDYVLRTLCEKTEMQLERAKSMQQSFKFPQTLFWYSLLAIEARTIDSTKPLATSQFDFLGGLLLRSIKVTQEKRASFDDDQRELLNEDPTLLLHIAALVAYLAKTLGTSRMSQIEKYLSSLIQRSSFPPAFSNAAGSIIKKLLPLYQFCHCCYSCTQNSSYKFVQFDHQIIWDYLAADFIVKTVVQKSYYSLWEHLNEEEDLRFDWTKSVKSTASQNSEWTQTLHLVADALTTMQLVTLMKDCDEMQAVTWLSTVRDHPRCRDVTNPSMEFVKLVLSSLFNSSRKSVSNPTHQRKKLKDVPDQWLEEDDVTNVGFDLAIKLFQQPILGQALLNDVCQFKSLSLLLDELRCRDRHQEFLTLLVQKFEMNEFSTSEELTSLVNQLSDSDYLPFIMDGLFYRLSSKCAEEAPGHPVRDFIHNIFVDVFKEERCADYLIELLKSADSPTQASASAVLSCFETLSNERIKRMFSMITPAHNYQRVINALPEVLPLELFDDLKEIALQSDSYMYFIYHAFNRFGPESYDKFVALFDHYQTYVIAKLKLSDKRDLKLSEQQISRLATIYSDPAAFYQRQLDNDDISGIKSCVVQVLQFQELKHEYKVLFNLLPKPKRPPPKRQIQIGDKHYEAAPIEEYMQTFCSGPVTEEQVMLLRVYYLPYYVTTAEPAFQMLSHVADQFKLLTDTITPEMIDNDDTICRSITSRADNHMIAARLIVQRFYSLTLLEKYFINDGHVAQLISFMNIAVKLRIAYRDEWHSLLDISDCETLFEALIYRKNANKWSVDTAVKLWQLLGTPHYQAYLGKAKQQFFPEIIPGMLEDWTQDDIDCFQALISDLECSSKLQLDVEKCIVNLLSEQ
jgi:hypothetical protein